MHRIIGQHENIMYIDIAHKLNSRAPDSVSSYEVYLCCQSSLSFFIENLNDMNVSGVTDSA